MRIAVVNSKGGVGKSTICASLAVRAAKDFPRVAIVDLDPQGSVNAWFAERTKAMPPDEPYNPDIYSGGSARASEALAEMALAIGEPDVVIFDGPPSSITATQDAINMADVVIVPVRASVVDLRASAPAIDHAVIKGKPLIVVINAVRTNIDRRLVAEAGAFLRDEYQIEPWGEVIGHRNAYANAMASGEGAGDRDSEANREISALWAQVRRLAGGRRGHLGGSP